MDNQKNEGFIGPIFVCIFCRQEFEFMNSLFGHMNKTHESELKNL